MTFLYNMHEHGTWRCDMWMKGVTCNDNPRWLTFLSLESPNMCTLLNEVCASCVKYFTCPLWLKQKVCCLRACIAYEGATLQSDNVETLPTTGFRGSGAKMLRFDRLRIKTLQKLRFQQIGWVYLAYVGSVRFAGPMKTWKRHLFVISTDINSSWHWNSLFLVVYFLCFWIFLGRCSTTLLVFTNTSFIIGIPSIHFIPLTCHQQHTNQMRY